MTPLEGGIRRALKYRAGGAAERLAPLRLLPYSRTQFMLLRALAYAPAVCVATCAFAGLLIWAAR